MRRSHRFTVSMIGLCLAGLALGVTLVTPSQRARAQDHGNVTAAPPPDVPGTGAAVPAPAPVTTPATTTPAAPAPATTPQAAAATADEATTYDQESVLKAATGVFGKGAEGLGKLIEKIFAEQGRPNAYIVGQEGGGALIVGLRYGNGTLYHKVEGERTVHWTGPSVGFDIGGDLSKSFTLVYHLNDSEDLFRRYPAVEGKVYFIGGFTANYHQREQVILVPIHLGAGWRIGANIGYLNYTKERTYLPF